MLPKHWTECHEEVTRHGIAQPCDGAPVVALRADVAEGYKNTNPRCWYPVCAKHVRAPMVDLWDAFTWAAGVDAQEAAA